VEINQPDVVEREIRIAASPETIFPFFTDPARIVQWQGRLASLDPRPGGAYRVVISEQAIARGEYVLVEPPHRVVFTFGWEGEGHPIPPGSSTVEVTLLADGDGTVVRLVHRDLPADALADHARGWDHYLPRLAQAVTGSASPDPWSSGPMSADATTVE
jgi:uncharacterized protein YndB with AHSA1/START domain